MRAWLIRALTVAVVATVSIGPSLSPATAAEKPCGTDVHTAKNGIDALFCRGADLAENGGHLGGNANAVDHGRPSFEWRLACGDKSVATNSGGAQPCAGDTGCPPKQHLYRLWQVTPDLVPMGIQCAQTTPQAPSQQLTAAMIARAFQHVPLPGLETHIQPKDETLVNFDTIFYTDAQPITRTLTLLGQRVTLDITPSSFRWTYGDGSEETTSVPGAPYPQKVVTHRYPHAHTTVAAHVAVTWTARYSVNGGASRPVDGTVTTVGPDTALRIAEAIPALSGAGH